jgi:hypothetical protein
MTAIEQPEENLVWAYRQPFDEADTLACLMCTNEHLNVPQQTILITNGPFLFIAPQLQVSLV